MSNITVENFTYSDRKGLLFRSGTHDEALEFVKAMIPTSDITTGWVKNEWGESPLRAHEDGLGAVFINARFTPACRDYYYSLLGKEATDLLLRHHNIY